MHDAARSPGVRVPPPLYYAAALLGGFALDGVLGAPNISLGWRLGAGVPLILLGVALDVWAAVTLRRERTTILPWRRADALVTSGPYRWTRNPIYLGYAISTLGATLALGGLAGLLTLPVAILAIDLLVVRREERHLEARFGARWRAYASRVRRWL